MAVDVEIGVDVDVDAVFDEAPERFDGPVAVVFDGLGYGDCECAWSSV